MKTMIIALSTAALIAAAPAVVAQGAPSQTPSAHHKISKQRHPGLSGYAVRREMEATAWRRGYPGAFGYAPAEPSGPHRDMTDISPYAGGGAGGGGSGGGGGGGM
jgi:hypothetical protein